MVLVQFEFAGMNIFSKLALDSGMNPFIHVAYRQMFASLVLAPVAYFIERQESAKLKTMAGQAKLLGTLLGVGGAMLLSLYHGPIIPIGRSSIHLGIANNANTNDVNHSQGNIIGPILVIISALTWAIWFIIQANMSDTYQAPYSTSALMLLMATVECFAFGFIVEHRISEWSLFPAIRALASIYGGVVCSGMGVCMMSWCIDRKGPLFVSVFSPLLLVIVAVLSWAFLREKLYLGTVLGSVLIVIGLYVVLWGKSKEMKSRQHQQQELLQDTKLDMEMH
ncbi:WAT1-related protein [Tanacetum coccineum]